MMSIEIKKNEEQEIIEMVKLMMDNGPEWTAALKELMQAADGASHDQIIKSVEFLEERKRERTKARLTDLIAEGEQIMENVPDRELTAQDLTILKQISNSDVFRFASNAFLIGVSLGHRIAEAEITKQG